MIPPATDVLSTGMWRGEPCIVVGGGPSVAGIPWFRLFNTTPWPRVIGCNMAYQLPYTDVALIVDSVLLEELENDPASGWNERREGMVTLLLRNAVELRLREGKARAERCHYLDTDRPDPSAPSRPWGRDLEHGVGGFTNCGLAALNLADILGVRMIYLVGFDMRGDGTGTMPHWHEYYRGKRLQKTDKPLAWFVEEFQKRVPERVADRVLVVTADTNHPLKNVASIHPIEFGWRLGANAL